MEDGDTTVDTPVSASELYDGITFKSPNDFYNQEAPAPYISFIIGGVLTALAGMYWYVRRWKPLMFRSTEADQKRGFFFSMIMVIATISDNDDPEYTMLRVASQSMLFLGGFQLHYQLTFLVMLFYYVILSLSDSLRVLISISGTDSLRDLITISKRDRSSLKSTLHLSTCPNGKACVDLKGGNVYEDITKPPLVVALVFFTQAVLISLIGVDIHNTALQTTLDGTKNVPVCGTMGSWLIYILGIFMQCVYILGPKSNFGTSEQNPHFWIKLFLAVKKTGAICSWFDPLDDQQKEIYLQHNDKRLWIPFVMSFLINGVGYHVLVHALPIQVAAQSTLTGVVIRAVGMIYLVDLDDAPGTAMKIIESRHPPAVHTTLTDHTVETSPNGQQSVKNIESTNEPIPPMAEDAPHSIILSSTPEEVIERARLQAEQIQLQLQKDLDILAARAAEESRKQSGAV